MEIIPARPAAFARPAAPLAVPVIRALEKMGIPEGRLYTHQAAAVNVLRGYDAGLDDSTNPIPSIGSVPHVHLQLLEQQSQLQAWSHAQPQTQNQAPTQHQDRGSQHKRVLPPPQALHGQLKQWSSQQPHPDGPYQGLRGGMGTEPLAGDMGASPQLQGLGSQSNFGHEARMECPPAPPACQLLPRRGRHVVVATSTSSGKSLCYLVPLLQVGDGREVSVRWPVGSWPRGTIGAEEIAE